MTTEEIEDLVQERIADAISKLTIQVTPDWEDSCKRIEVALLYDGKVISQDSMFVD